MTTLRAMAHNKNPDVRFQIDEPDSEVDSDGSSTASQPADCDENHHSNTVTVRVPQNKPKQQAKGRRVEFAMDDVERSPVKKDVESDLNKIIFKGSRSTRFQQPRMSLLGKPINYRAHKRDMRYRRLQARIYNFLERPKDWRSISYHLLV